MAALRLGADGWRSLCGVGSTEVVDVAVEGSGGWVAAVAVRVERGGGPVEPLDEGLDASFGRQFGDSVEDRSCAVELAELQAGGEGVDACHGDAAVGRLPAGGHGVG